MPAKKSQLTNPWAAIDALMKTDPEPTGPEWFTVEAFATRYGMSIPGAGQKLTRLAVAGTMDRWSGVSSISKRRINKYRLKP